MENYQSELAYIRQHYSAEEIRDGYARGYWAWIHETDLPDDDDDDDACPECQRSNGPHYRGECEHGK